MNNIQITLVAVLSTCCFNTSYSMENTMTTRIEPEFIQSLLEISNKDGIQKKVVGAVVTINGKFLLLKRVANDFMGGLVELPSGAVDPNEELLDALKREVLEETGLSVGAIKCYIDSFDYRSGSGKLTRQFNFLVEVKEGNIRLAPDEHDAFYLVGLTDEVFATLNISNATRNILTQAFQIISTMA